jgi:hypothetical protein
MVTPDMVEEVEHDAKVCTAREAHELGKLANGKLEAQKGVEQPEQATDSHRILEAKVLLELDNFRKLSHRCLVLPVIHYQYEFNSSPP